VAASCPSEVCILTVRCPGTNRVHPVPVPDPDNVNSAMEYFCFAGDESDEAVRNRVQLFHQLIRERTFDTLRTKEQLGYVTQSIIRSSIGMTGVSFLIQSERDTTYLEERVNTYIASTKDWLAQMSQEEFEGQKQSLINKKLEDFKNMSEE
jgi:insulysin